MIAFKRDRAILELPKSLYSRGALEAGALALGNRAQVFLEERRGLYRAEVRPARPEAARARILAGEFLNEALSHECRQRTIRSHRELAGAVLSMILESGFPAMPPDPLEQLEPQVRADREEELRRLMEGAEKMR